MATRWCSSCGQAFVPAPQVPRQMYCALPGCQRERRRLWQIAKRRSDPDYLANQARAQKAWSERNPEYWRTYRETNPGYASGNRAQQRVRNRKSRNVNCLTAYRPRRRSRQLTLRDK